MAAVFVVDVAGWNHAFESRGGIVGDHIRGLAVKTSTVARVTSPIRTGRMAHSIIPRHNSGTTWHVIALASYALFVHEGTRPHQIWPKKAGGRLKFFWPKVGRVVYPRMVNHPGTKAQPWLMDALRRVIK